MRRLGCLAVAVALFAAGCGGGGSAAPARKNPDARAGSAHAPPRTAGDSQVIHGWIAALDAGNFDRAADYFGTGALVQQTRGFRLSSHAAAVAFNRSLPCRASVTSIVREGRASLASFSLREGADGQCKEGGTAQVRFVIRGGRIREWRQLAAPAAPRGTTA